MGFILKLLGGPIVSTVVSAVVDGVKSWGERKRIRNVARIELEHKRATADIDWDHLQVKASEHSWKDEFWTVILAVPLVLAFVPSLAPYVEQGFLVLRDSTPDWYKAALGVAIGAAFGVRKLTKIMAQRAEARK